MKLTPQNVEELFIKCLFLDGEDTSKAKIINGVVIKVGFNPEGIGENKNEIKDLLIQCHPDFMSTSKAQGMSFLYFCIDKDENQWTGMHTVCDNLICLGMAIDKVKFLLPREMWTILPGAMPYIQILN